MPRQARIEIPGLLHHVIVRGVEKCSAASQTSSGGKRSSLAFDSNLEDADLFDDRILGGGDFVEGVLSRAGQDAAGPQKSLTEIIDQVAICFGIERSRLHKRGKERILARAKAVICYIAVREMGFRGVDIAPALAFTPGAVSHAARRGERFFGKRRICKRR